MVIGIPVTRSHAGLAPAWTLALPVGVVSLGLFLLSLLCQKEIAKAVSLLEQSLPMPEGRCVTWNSDTDHLPQGTRAPLLDGGADRNRTCDLLIANERNNVVNTGILFGSAIASPLFSEGVGAAPPVIWMHSVKMAF